MSQPVALMLPPPLSIVMPVVATTAAVSPMDDSVVQLAAAAGVAVNNKDDAVIPAALKAPTVSPAAPKRRVQRLPTFIRAPPSPPMRNELTAFPTQRPRADGRRPM